MIILIRLRLHGIFFFLDLEDRDKSLEKFNRIRNKSKKKSQVLFDLERESMRKLLARKEKLKKLRFESRNQERPAGFGESFDLKKILDDYDIVDVHNVELPPYILLKLNESPWCKEQDFERDYGLKNNLSKVYRETPDRIQSRGFKNLKDASVQICDSDFQKVR